MLRVLVFVLLASSVSLAARLTQCVQHCPQGTSDDTPGVCTPYQDGLAQLLITEDTCHVEGTGDYCGCGFPTDDGRSYIASPKDTTLDDCDYFKGVVYRKIRKTDSHYGKPLVGAPVLCPD